MPVNKYKITLLNSETTDSTTNNSTTLGVRTRVSPVRARRALRSFGPLNLLQSRTQQFNFSTDGFLKIPFKLDFNSVDQAEVVNREFVEEEVEEAINPIVDYETTRFVPLSSQGGLIKDVKYKPVFLDNNGALPSQTYYSDIGFSNEDIKFQKNRFKQSFLRLSF